MARRMRRARARRSQKLVWDTINMVQADLPTVLLDSTAARDGAFSSIRRYTGTDLTVLRTLFNSYIEIRQDESFQVDTAAMLEICVGLSWFDSSTDTDGLAINTGIAQGAGPLTDADNSRWYARCCVTIPIGSFVERLDSGYAVFPLGGGRNSPATGFWSHGGGVAANEQTTGFYCEWDSKSKRRQHGIETEWLQVAMEAEVSITPVGGSEIQILMQSFNGRHVLNVH